MPLGPIVEATVGCRDVARSAAFGARAFGLETLRADGGTLVLGVAGVSTGRLRLVPGNDPGLPAPDPWEIGPRFLGLYSRDLARTKAAVEEAGGSVGPIVGYPYGEFMNECLVRGPDDLFWTIPRVSPRRPSPALHRDPDRLHGELHSAVVNVEDMEEALRFFTQAGGLRVLFDGIMAGEPFERMIGLPSGASLRLAFLSAADEAPARLELMQFFGVPPAPRHDRPIGLRRLAFAAGDPEGVIAALVRAGGRRLGSSLVQGPAGIEVELVRP